MFFKANFKAWLDTADVMKPQDSSQLHFHFPESHSVSISEELFLVCWPLQTFGTNSVLFI